MELSELLEILEIESPQDFQYFENMAALIENDYTIPSDLIFMLFREVNSENASDVIEEYFDDLLTGVPDRETELYSILDNEKTALCGLLNSDEGDRGISKLAEEIESFRDWYVFGSGVVCRDSATGAVSNESVMDALTMLRADSITGAKKEYDFSDACDYEVDEYVVNVGIDMLDFDEEDAIQYGPGDEKEALLNSDFLYDDELSDY